jgi:hypothetical protein
MSLDRAPAAGGRNTDRGHSSPTTSAMIRAGLREPLEIGSGGLTRGVVHDVEAAGTVDLGEPRSRAARAAPALDAVPSAGDEAKGGPGAEVARASRRTTRRPAER